MRVLHVFSSLDDKTGGPIRAVVDLSAGAMKYGLDSEIVGIGPVSIADSELPTDRIRPIAGRAKGYHYSGNFRAWLNQNVRSFDGVVLHGMWQYPSLAAARACSKHQVPYVCFPHGMLDLWPVHEQGRWKSLKKTSYWHLVEKRIFRESKCVFYTTNRELRNADRTFRLEIRNKVVVPYGVSTKSFNFNSIAGANSPAPLIPLISNYVLFLGRIHPKKNVRQLVQWWAVARKPANWDLVIAGTGPSFYLAELQSDIHRLGSSKSIRLVGHVTGPQKANLIRNAKWFVLPSSQENFGVSVIEALCHGVPVVISEHVYVSEYFHRESEILPLEPHSWITFFEERMGDEDRRAHLIKLDAEDVLRTFQFDDVVRRWVETIRKTFAAVV